MSPTITEPPKLEDIHEDHQAQLQAQISLLVPFVCGLQFALSCHTLVEVCLLQFKFTHLLATNE